VKNAEPMVEIRIAGVQNKKILNSLLSRRLAPQNANENNIAKNHQTGERTALQSTAIPVAFDPDRTAVSHQMPIAASIVPASRLMNTRIIHLAGKS